MTAAVLQPTPTRLVSRVRRILDGLAADVAARGIPGEEQIAELPIQLHRGTGWTIAVANPAYNPTLHVSRAVACLPKEQVRGILAHEVGHVCDRSERRLGRVDLAVRIALAVSPALPAAVGLGPGAAVAMAALQLARQRREYAADAFAHSLGHGPGLQAFLTAFAGATGESLARRSDANETHPSPGDRIRRLAALG